MNREPFFYRILENPLFYRISQYILGPGAENDLRLGFHNSLRQIPPNSRVLDVGCGPHSWLWGEGLHPVGLDISISYSRAFRERGETAVNGSAMALPFPVGSFHAVWSAGLLHHLPDSFARDAVIEMVRVTSPTGFCLIFDSVLPEPAWKRPIAHLIRRLDRGAYVRRQSALTALLPEEGWSLKRISYTCWGLEGLFCLLVPQRSFQS